MRRSCAFSPDVPRCIFSQGVSLFSGPLVKEVQRELPWHDNELIASSLTELKCPALSVFESFGCSKLGLIAAPGRSLRSRLGAGSESVRSQAHSTDQGSVAGAAAQCL